MFNIETRKRCWKKIDEQYREEKTKYELFYDLFTSRSSSPSLIVDLGCGTKTYRQSGHTNTIRFLIGVDIDQRALAENKDVNAKIAADIHTLPIASESINYAISQFAIEHLRHPDKVFREVSRILKKGGCFVVMTPNLYGFSAFTARLIPNRYHSTLLRVITGTDEVECFPTYYRANTILRLDRKLRKAGLAKDYRIMYQPPPYGLIFSRFACQLGIWYCKLISSFESLSFLRGVIIASYRKL